jgi:CheY-like chemotaxis protein
VSANLESRVLVVDDCEPLRYLKTQYLLEAGFHVSQADTGRAALRSIETERPDLVLLDVNLPDMHGSEVCREVKTRWDLLVIYTSSVDIPAELHGMANGCLSRPPIPPGRQPTRRDPTGDAAPVARKCRAEPVAALSTAMTAATVGAATRAVRASAAAITA